MNAKQVILTRLLPKTGQTVSYGEGDDGFWEKGWWKGRSVANNKTRFIAKTIGGDDVVVDLATGLMFAADGNGLGCGEGGTFNWVNALLQGHDENFAGFVDWRLPNIKELFSIVDYTQNQPAIDATLFPNTSTGAYWSSTTASFPNTNAWAILLGTGQVAQAAKTTVYAMRGVRSI